MASVDVLLDMSQRNSEITTRSEKVHASCHDLYPFKGSQENLIYSKTMVIVMLCWLTNVLHVTKCQAFKLMLLRVLMKMNNSSGKFCNYKSFGSY